MSRPELRLNPIDVGRLFNALAPHSLDTPEESARKDRLADLARHAPLSSLPVISDASVEVGHMWLRDAAPQPEFDVPVAFSPAVLEWRDRIEADMRGTFDELLSPMGFE